MSLISHSSRRGRAQCSEHFSSTCPPPTLHGVREVQSEESSAAASGETSWLCHRAGSPQVRATPGGQPAARPSSTARRPTPLLTSSVLAGEPRIWPNTVLGKGCTKGLFSPVGEVHNGKDTQEGRWKGRDHRGCASLRLTPRRRRLAASKGNGRGCRKEQAQTRFPGPLAAPGHTVSSTKCDFSVAVKMLI